MIARPQAAIALPRTELLRLIDQHGPARIAAALLITLATRKRGSTGGQRQMDLSPHLRRDIGLPPTAARREYWDHL